LLAGFFLGEEFRYITHEFLNMYKTGKKFYGCVGRYMICVLGNAILSPPVVLQEWFLVLYWSCAHTIAVRSCPLVLGKSHCKWE